MGRASFQGAGAWQVWGKGKLALEPLPGLSPHDIFGASAALLLPEMEDSALIFCPATELSAAFKTHTHILLPESTLSFCVFLFVCFRHKVICKYTELDMAERLNNNL